MLGDVIYTVAPGNGGECGAPGDSPKKGRPQVRRTWGFTTLQPSPRCGLHCPGCGCNGRVTVDGTHWPGDRESRAAPGRGRQRLTLTEVGRLGAVVSRAESVGCRGLRSGLGKDGKYGSIGCRTSGRTSGHHRHVAGPRCGAPRASPAPLAAPGASFPVKPQVHLTPPRSRATLRITPAPWLASGVSLA